ncbi:conserved hypothetical protein [Psychromonas ingrahamii 37]|uniref:Glycosyl transferase family 28 C-terminal domain-containing protein n=1 Tax=Psychromonas ingrahamii (strain DSM 17664 / CCUG 51855 / 37) TaxID=357804 RepID=A1SR51_PSYIN|nr:hypothetical protein [Psychromonas ingrahamii]ABM01966.1 conserved hypothetical protein [Psychromonas ingrahamii 37]
MHLCFSITAHGFGHAAISCAVINQVKEKYPNIKITVLSLVSRVYLQSRLTCEFELIPLGNDFGMLMVSPVEVDVQASALKYLSLYDNWQKAVEQEKLILEQIKPDCLISNISPVSLDAAMQLNIPTASVAPFNWAQIYQAYCLKPEQPEINKAKSIFDKMVSIYEKVDFIYKPLPSVPFTKEKEIQVASICDHPPLPSVPLLQKLPAGTDKIGLVALGGLPMRLDLENWPHITGWHWLVDQNAGQLRDDMSQLTELPFSFLQLLSCSDLILTKPGYGTYCEIAAIAKYQKVRVISIERPDWPETPFLNQFLSARVPFVEIKLSQLSNDSLTTVIKQLDRLDYPRIQACEDGAVQLVIHLLGQLNNG